MPFTINQKLCGSCGSCWSICSNSAVVKREGGYFVSEMCCDCGVCVPYCPTDAIGAGDVKVELNNKKLNHALKDKLSLTKDIAAMKFADKPPQGVRVDEGPQFWCSICGDIFDSTEDKVYFSAKASACSSAMIGLGTGKYSREVFDAAMKAEVTGEGKHFATKDEMSKARSFFPRYPKAFGGMIMASLEEMPMPDLVLFPVTGRQMSMISTAYTFDTGQIITGYMGSSLCMMTIAIPFLENRPVFTCGDYSGRSFMRLEDGENIVCFPYKLIPGLIKNLDRTIYAHTTDESE